MHRRDRLDPLSAFDLPAISAYFGSTRCHKKVMHQPACPALTGELGGHGEIRQARMLTMRCYTIRQMAHFIRDSDFRLGQPGAKRQGFCWPLLQYGAE
jgi:hypothetical protein